MLYRVWNAVNRRPGTGIQDAHRMFFSVASPREGADVIEHLQVRRDEDAAVVISEYGLEMLVAGEWREWRDGDGYDVMEHFRLLLVEAQ